MNKRILLIPILALLVLPACKTTKTIANKQPEIKLVSQVAVFTGEVKKNQPQFETANISKMTLDMDITDRKLSVSASCKIRKDSAIFASFQVFGFEVFKAELMPDSLKVFDKMNRRYYVTDYSYFGKRFGVNVDFYSLQSLLTAQLFCIGQREIRPDSCKLETLPDGQKSLVYETPDMLQDTRISALNVLQEVILKAKNNDYKLQTTYADYAKVSEVNFPQKISLVASNSKMNASCDFSILKVDFNTNIKFIATSPVKYSRGDIEQILKK